MEIHQREGVDAGIIMTGIAAIAGGVAVDGCAQHGIFVCGFVSHLLWRFARLAPRGHPSIFVYTIEQLPRRRILQIQIKKLAVIHTCTMQ